MDDIVKLVSAVTQLGFSVFVAVYLLTRVDRVLTALLTQNAELLGLMRDVRTTMWVRGGKEPPV